MRKTEIVATLWPASSDKAVIERLVDAGCGSISRMGLRKTYCLRPDGA